MTTKPHLYCGLELFINDNEIHNKIYRIIGSLRYAIKTRDDSWSNPTRSQEQVAYIDKKWEELRLAMIEAGDSVKGKLKI
jgi:hypothetical protein